MIGYDSPELENLARAEMLHKRRLVLRGIFSAAAGLVGGGEGGALRELELEEGMDPQTAERFAEHFRPYVLDMAAALEGAGGIEDVPDMFAENVRKRREGVA